MVAKAGSYVADECPSPRRAVAVVILSCLLQTLFLSSLLSEPAYCPFLSTSFWTWQVELLGSEIQVDHSTGRAFASVPLGMLFASILLKSVVMLFAVGTAAAKLTRRPVIEVILRWAWLGWLWLCGLGGYEVFRVALQMCGFFDAAEVLGIFAYYFSAISVAGCLAMLVPAVRATGAGKPVATPAVPASSNTDSWSISRATLAAAAIFSVVFTAMNWQIYNGLLLPHGDSAMYGEHLWNITHGKGFAAISIRGCFWASTFRSCICCCCRCMSSGHLSYCWNFARHSCSPLERSRFSGWPVDIPARRHAEVFWQSPGCFIRRCSFSTLKLT